MKAAPLFVVDAFTEKRFSGNPAAVCFLPTATEVSDDTLQAIAAEANLSETVFLSPSSAPPADDGNNEPCFTIRWFTPQTEVGLCGHATLAAAHSIFENLPLLARDVYAGWKQLETTPDGIRFSSKTSGWLSVRRVDSLYELDFPLRHPRDVVIPRELTQRVLQVFGLDPSTVDTAVDGWALHDGSRKYLLILKDPRLLEKVSLPNAQLLMEAMVDEALPLEPLSVTITALVSSATPAGADSHEGSDRCARWLNGGFDVVSRHFAPWVGIPEDPVTGAAHVVLAPYWINRRMGSLAPGASLSCFQASKRGGNMTCIVKPNDRIGLQGSAVTFLAGSIVV